MGEQQAGLGPGWTPQQDNPRETAPEWVGVVGWLAAIFFPPIGLACGAYLVTKGSKGEGFGMMALAVVSAVVWVLIVPGSASAASA